MKLVMIFSKIFYILPKFIVFFFPTLSRGYYLRYATTWAEIFTVLKFPIEGFRILRCQFPATRCQVIASKLARIERQGRFERDKCGRRNENVFSSPLIASTNFLFGNYHRIRFGWRFATMEKFFTDDEAGVWRAYRAWCNFFPLTRPCCQFHISVVSAKNEDT